MWMAQLTAFAEASDETQAAVASLLPTVADRGDQPSKEVTTFAWCVKYDAMTPVACAELRELDQSVIEGVLELFDVYGVILPSAQPQPQPQPQPHEVPTPGKKCVSYESFDLPLLLVCL